MKYFMMMAGLIALVSCSKPGLEQDCPVPIDTVAIVDTLKQADTTYYLVHRVTGWHDKTEILELYNAEPKFDHCARSSLEPVYGDSLEIDQAVTHIYLDPTYHTLQIEYQLKPSSVIHHQNFKLEVKQAQ